MPGLSVIWLRFIFSWDQKVCKQAESCADGFLAFLFDLVFLFEPIVWNQANSCAQGLLVFLYDQKCGIEQIMQMAVWSAFFTKSVGSVMKVLGVWCKGPFGLLCRRQSGQH